MAFPTYFPHKSIYCSDIREYNAWMCESNSEWGAEEDQWQMASGPGHTRGVRGNLFGRPEQLRTLPEDHVLLLSRRPLQW